MSDYKQVVLPFLMNPLYQPVGVVGEDAVFPIIANSQKLVVSGSYETT